LKTGCCCNYENSIVIYTKYWTVPKIGNKELPELFSAFLYETFLTSNFGLFENASNCVDTPIEVEDTPPDHFIFEIQVKGPQRLVLSQDQYTPASRS